MPGLEETENEWRFRLRDPGDFRDDSFRRKEIAPGVSLVLGKLTSGGDTMVAQALRLDKDKFDSRDKAQAWLDAHKADFQESAGRENLATELAEAARDHSSAGLEADLETAVRALAVDEAGAAEKAEAVLLRLREASPAKTEDGEQYPAEAYAYAPDPAAPATWALRIRESAERGVTRAQLGRCAAALSPGGFRGKRVDIPRESMATAKARLRAAYREIGVEADEMPRWVKESATMERYLHCEAAPLGAGAYDAEKGEVELTIIRPGFNDSKERFYPPEVLKRDAPIFEGVKMFANHPTASEEKARPEGSIRDWVGQLKNVRAEADGTITGRAVIIETWLKDKLRNLQAAGILSEMGISIRAIGEGVKAQVEGVKTSLVERLVKGRSVDFVTYPGAGGRVEAYESEAPERDVDLVTLPALREARPDLVGAIERDLREAILAEGEAKMKELTDLQESLAARETELAEKNVALTALTVERDELKAKVEGAQRAAAKATAQVAITEVIANAKDLPEPAKTRLAQRFAEAESIEGVEEAIAGEREYVKSLNVVKVTGMGGGAGDGGDATGAKELVATLEESFRRRGLSEAEAKRKAENVARGR